MNISSHLARTFLLLVSLSYGIIAVAQDDEPLRPADAYRYAVADTGDAIEIDWSIEDGYYLYREKMSFESSTAAVVLGEPEMPEGLEHEDEFFGKQQIYRGNFFVRVPFTINGDRPDSMEFVLKSQGCADMGLCYPPQTWREEVKLRNVASTTAKLDLGGVGGQDNGFLPVDEAFQPILTALDMKTIYPWW